MDVAPAMATCADLLRDAAARLRGAGIDTARLDAEVLLAAAMRCDRAALYARLRSLPEPASAERFAALLARRARREPIAYITGRQEFWSLSFAVSPAVLIPRPESELLVEIACRLARGGSPAPSLCDVGTGSGCIAVALARELPAARVAALDVSREALAVAAGNAAAHGVGDRVACLESDLFAAVPAGSRFDVVVSNPPYCRPHDPQSPELAFEPRQALVAGADGLATIRRLLATAPAHVRRGGWLVMEFGMGQDAAIRAEVAAGGWRDVSVEADLAGIPRVLVARRA